MMDETKKIAQALVSAIDKKFGQDIVAIDLREATSAFDVFVIATGGSQPQTQAMIQAAQECLAEHNVQIKHIEGLQNGTWVLLDAGFIVVHIFDKESREFYNLERVWGDGVKIHA